MRASAASFVGQRPAVGALDRAGAGGAATPSSLSIPRPSRLSPPARAMASKQYSASQQWGTRRAMPQQGPGSCPSGPAAGQANQIVPVPCKLRRPEELRAAAGHKPDSQACSMAAQPEQAAAAVEQEQQAAPAGNDVTAFGSSGTSSPSPTGRSPASQPAPAQLDGLHKPVGMVVGSAWLLATSVQLAGAAALTPLWLPALAGGTLGGLYSAVNHLGARRFWRAPGTTLRVVISGGSSGIGKAMAREFLRCGDRVLVTSRSAEGARQAAEQLRLEVGPGADVAGVECDVSDPESVERLMAAAQQQLGGIDCLINNAGYSGSFKRLLDQPADQIERVVRTNLLGSLFATRAAMRVMSAQPGGTAGHIFNLEGAGSDGSATPQYAAYGATKAGLAQLLKTLQHEAAALGGASPVCVHNLSPGMVLTDLLLEGATDKNKQVFNILCEHPETVAAFLVPRARSVVARGQSGAAIRYLTPVRALAKLLAAPLHFERYFDRHGRPVYLSERERLSGGQARRTQRLQERAARRSGPLQLAYSLSMALSFLLIVSDALAKAPPQGL